MTDSEPSVSRRLDRLETHVDNHINGRTVAMWEGVLAWGRALEARLDDHDTRIRLLEQGASRSDDPVVGV